MSQYVETTGRKAIGERLVDAGVITSSQLEIALKEQRRTGEQLGFILRNLGFVTEESLSATLSAELGASVVSLATRAPTSQSLAAVPARLAREHCLVPLDASSGTLTVAMADPCNIVAIDALRRETNMAVSVCAAAPRDIRAAIERWYPDPDSQNAQIEELIESARKVVEAQSEADAAQQAPIVELVDQLVFKGLKDNSTDIHIEPDEKLVRTRYRLDGILHQGASIPKSLQLALISRLKIMADLDISERRTPQDGRIRFNRKGLSVDLRVSVYPTAHGENIVLRILDKSNVTLQLEQLGFKPEVRDTLKTLVDRPHGMLLVTGPTGSGKTTTLYSLLAEVNSLEKNVITIEDPIEYQLPMIRQSQVNPKIGLTFATGLRAILRQDPDVILVGEVRDIETARIAISSALTGHMVLTTLHTNTAAGALLRLMDMGIEPFLLSSAVSGVLAQRLLRTICSRCSEPYKPSAVECEQLSCDAAVTLYRGRGCPGCRGTGYRGRTVIYELIVLNESIRRLVLERASESEIIRQMQADGMQPMYDLGVQKVLDGTTTLEELARVCRTAL